MDPGFVSKIERGVRPPPQIVPHVHRIAAVLGFDQSSEEFRMLVEAAYQGRFGEKPKGGVAEIVTVIPASLVSPGSTGLSGLPLQTRSTETAQPLVGLVGAAATTPTASLLDQLAQEGQPLRRSNDQPPRFQESLDTPEDWGQMLNQCGLGLWLYRTITSAGLRITQFGYDKQTFSFEVDLPDGKRHRLGMVLTVT